MKKTEEVKEETQGNEAFVPVWAKISVLIILVLLLVAGIILPVKIVPQALSMLSSTISSVFIPREDSTAEISAPIFTVENPVVENVATTTKEELEVALPKPKPVAPKISAPYGLADLEVKILGVGYLTRINNIFIPSNIIYSDRQAAVKFQIINKGTNNTGAWGFSAELPSVTDPHYDSALQQNLRPGDRIEYVMGFNNPTASQIHVGTITANPSNTIAEISKANNTATVSFPIVNALAN